MPAMELEVVLFILACFFVVLFSGVIRIWRKRHQEARSLTRYNEVQRAGLVIPPTLHPVFDPNRCIGSGTCTHVCPQGADVLGRIQGRGVLIDPSMCIGHGRCAAECPVGAIRLVFGTAERGVDIPNLSPTFETNVPGLYITGELGGMGLIANAVRQAQEGMENIRDALRKRPSGKSAEDAATIVDVAVVGAGPAGLTAALAAMALGLSYRLFDKEQELGGAIRHYPRRKIVMTHPVAMPLAGVVHAGTMTKEQLLALWQSIIATHRVPLESGVSIDAISRDAEGIFTLTGGAVTLRARTVMLAIGRRGTPRKLGVPGEDRPTIFYAMLEPETHAGRRVLVVGGGDSAAETACTLAEETDAAVAISFLDTGLTNAKPQNRTRFEALVAQGRITAYRRSAVKEIRDGEVVLALGEELVTVPNDDVIVLIGGVLPTAMLTRIGVQIERHFGEETEAHRHLDTLDIFDRIRAQARAKGLKDFRAGPVGARPWLKWLIAAAGLGALAALFVLGRDYYLASPTLRRETAALRFFSASGLFGHTLGVSAALLMLVNLTYFARKELKSLSGKGDIHTWMLLHQTSGLMAGAVVLLHTGLILYNAFAFALYLGLAVVVTTGIIGRYFFGMVPLDPRGRPLTHEALVDLSHRMEKDYVALFGALDAAVEIRKVLDLSHAVRLSWPRLLLGLFTTWPLRHLRLRLIIRRARARTTSHEAFHAFKRYSNEMFRLRLQMDLAPQLKRLLGTWRTAHALLAILTVFLIAAHVTVEIWVGYRWIF